MDTIEHKDVVMKVSQDSLHAQHSFLLGRLKTLIDASIVDKEQNKALKDLIAIEVWGRHNYMLDIWDGKGRLIDDGTTKIA